MNRYTNAQLADVFNLIGNLLEIKGEVIYKILAYRKAAESLTSLGRDINDVWREGTLLEVPGVGKAIAEKIDELLTTGKLGFLEKLKTEVPETLAEMLPVPDLGPKKIALFWKQLGITSLAELEAAARQGRLRDLPGMGEKSEAKILQGIESLSRRSGRIPLGRAWPFAQQMLALLRAVPGVTAVETAGSLRRMRATIGDIDLLAAASDSKAVMAAFAGHPEVVRVLGQGEMKCSVEFTHGLRAQLWVHPPERFGTALQYATGSKDHNVRLRELALKQGLSLSEHALTRLDGSGDVLCATEAEVYAALGLPYIPPELREDRGEVQAARAGELPHLLELADLRSELHAHTQWSDGKLTVLELAEAALKRGKRVLAITDHSEGLAVAGGLSPERLRQQRVEIDAARAKLGDRIPCCRGRRLKSGRTAPWIIPRRSWKSWILSLPRCTPVCASRGRR